MVAVDAEAIVADNVKLGQMGGAHESEKTSSECLRTIMHRSWVATARIESQKNTKGQVKIRLTGKERREGTLRCTS